MELNHQTDNGICRLLILACSVQSMKSVWSVIAVASGELSEVGKWHAAETTNGDCPHCTSSSPSPERIDEAFLWRITA
jgi:hypothetical protein